MLAREAIANLARLGSHRGCRTMVRAARGYRRATWANVDTPRADTTGPSHTPWPTDATRTDPGPSHTARTTDTTRAARTTDATRADPGPPRAAWSSNTARSTDATRADAGASRAACGLCANRMPARTPTGGTSSGAWAGRSGRRGEATATTTRRTSTTTATSTPTAASTPAAALGQKLGGYQESNYDEAERQDYALFHRCTFVAELCDKS